LLAPFEGRLELKRSSVSVANGIRQNYDSQKKEFIRPFFSTVQFLFAGNDTEGLRYGTIETPEKYYLEWKEPSDEPNKLDAGILQMCAKDRLLEFSRDPNQNHRAERRSHNARDQSSHRLKSHQTNEEASNHRANYAERDIHKWAVA